MKRENSPAAEMSEDDDFGEANMEQNDDDDELEFDITNPLKPSRVVSYTAKSLSGACLALFFPRRRSLISILDQIADGDIDINPVYQRGQTRASS